MRYLASALQTVKVIETKDSLRNTHSSEEPRETGCWTGAWCPGWDPGTEGRTLGKS